MIWKDEKNLNITCRSEVKVSSRVNIGINWVKIWWLMMIGWFFLLASQNAWTNNNMLQWICHVTATSMLNKLWRGEKTAMANTHYPHFLTFPIPVKKTFYPSSIRTITFCGDTGHVFQQVPHNVFGSVLGYWMLVRFTSHTHCTSILATILCNTCLGCNCWFQLTIWLQVATSRASNIYWCWSWSGEKMGCKII